VIALNDHWTAHCWSPGGNRAINPAFTDSIRTSNIQRNIEIHILLMAVWSLETMKIKYQFSSQYRKIGWLTKNIDVDKFFGRYIMMNS